MEDLENMRCLIACGDRTVISKGKRDKIQERKKKIHSFKYCKGSGSTVLHPCVEYTTIYCGHTSKCFLVYIIFYIF